MTRREYIAEQLLNPDRECPDVYGAVIGNFIACPYFSDSETYRCEAMNWEVCINCKDAWLDREIDT